MFVRTLILNLPPRQDLAALSQWLSGTEICTLFTAISGITCTYQQFTHVEMEALFPTGHIFADILNYTKNFQYYEPFVSPPSQLEHHHDVRMPTTDFETFLKQDLPDRLQEFLKPPAPSTLHIFQSCGRVGEEEVRVTSEAMEELGFEVPVKVNANGHDKNEFIENHSMVPSERRRKSISEGVD